MTATAAESTNRRIQQALDITDVVAEHVRLTRAGKDFKGLCPFHQEKTPSFFVVPAKQIFKCFGCGVGGDVFKFIQLREQVDFREARAILAARAGITLETDRFGQGEGPGQGRDKAALARVNDWAMRWFRRKFAEETGTAAREYAARRGLSPESIEAFGIGFAPAGWQELLEAATRAGIPRPLLEAAGLVKVRPEGGCYDTFRDRLMFPIRDTMNRVIGFGGRVLGDDPAKYLNSPQTALFDKGACLYGMDLARSKVSETGQAVVVEGYLDCVMAHQFGFRNTVATLGTALGASHAGVLRRYADVVILLFDSDEAGQRAADRALPVFFTHALDVRLARVPSGKDPCEFLLSAGAEAFAGILNSATDALEWKWQQLLVRYEGATSGRGRRRAIQEFLEIVAAAIESGSVDPIQRGLILNQVGKLLGISAEEVQRQVLHLTGSPRAADSSAGAGRSGAGSLPAIQDAAACATRELLEVLLNEPGYACSIGEHFDPDLLGDDDLRRIGKLVAEMAANENEWTLSALLARVESVEDARRITDLQVAGARRGNYAARVQGAVARLQEVRRRRGADELRRTLCDPSQANETVDAEARARIALARQHRHFAARKHLAALTAGSANAGEAAAVVPGRTTE